MPPAEAPASFAPLRPAPRARVRVAFLVGSVSWLLALVVLAFVVRRRDAVELALLVVAASFVVGLLVSAWMRSARVRAERGP